MMTIQKRRKRDNVALKIEDSGESIKKPKN
jgi:hypothetical protein